MVRYRTVDVGSVRMFYREAGAVTAPAILLLHGFPTSSHMYRNLIPELADRYRVIAPDYPGFGHTQAPPRGSYVYTFENIYDTIEAFIHVLGLDRFALMVFDYGAPIGLRLAAAYASRVSALISQNGNAYEEGLRYENLGAMRAYWENPVADNRDALRGLLTLEATWRQYRHGVPASRHELISPDAVAHDQAIIDRDPEIQLDLFGDYLSNIALYPRWQRYLRTARPPVLAVWGAGDFFFRPAGAHAFRRDVPDAEVHILDTGRFALETDGPAIAALIRDFLSRRLAG